jgi:hypothetical protein
MGALLLLTGDRDILFARLTISFVNGSRIFYEKASLKSKATQKKKKPVAIGKPKIHRCFKFPPFP